MSKSLSANQQRTLNNKNIDQEQKNSFVKSRLGVAILLLGFMYTLMGTVIYPALPGIQQKYGLSAAQLSLMSSLPALVSMSLQPLAGWISDHVDRKMIVALGLIAYVIGGSVVGFIVLSTIISYSLVLTGRTITGLGELGAFPQYLAIIHEKIPKQNQQRMVGILESITSLGSVLAPLIGGTLATISLAYPFFATSIFGLVALLLALWAIPPIKPSAQPSGRNAQSHKAQFHFSYLGGSLVMGTLVTINTFIGTYLQDTFNFNTTSIGFMIAVSPLAMAAGSILAGHHGNDGDITTKHLGFLGGIGISGLLLAGFTHNAWMLAFGLFLNGCVLGYWLSALDHDAMSFGNPETRGLRLAMFQQAKAFGVLIFPFICGLVIDETGSINLTFYLLALAMLIIGGVVLQIRYRYNN